MAGNLVADFIYEEHSSIKFLVIGLKSSEEGYELVTICNVNFLKKK